MRCILAVTLMLAASACAAVPPAGATDQAMPRSEEPVVGGGAGGACDAAPAQGLVGRASSEALGSEALRLSGARSLRWIPEGGMVTMDYREDRLNIELDRTNKVVTIRCG